MPVVRVPTVLRKHTGGEGQVTAPGATVREVFGALVATHPELEEQLFEDGELRGFVNVFVEDEDIRFIEGLDSPVDDDDEISIMPAVAGGAEPAERASTPGAVRPAGGAEPAERASTPGAVRPAGGAD